VFYKGPIPNNNPGWRPAGLAARAKPKAADIERSINNGEVPNPMVSLNKENGLVYVFFLTYAWRILMFIVVILQLTVPKCVGCCLIRSLPFVVTCARSILVQVSKHSRSAEHMLILSSPPRRP
jgi:hypothetical protein